VLASRPLVSLPLLGAIVASAGIHLVAVLVPALRPVFRTYALDGRAWMLLLALAALIVPLVEIAKFVYRRIHPEDARAAPPSSGSVKNRA